MKLFTRVLLPVALMASMAAQASPVPPVFSENFDELTPALGVTSAGLFSTIANTNVDIVGGTDFPLCNGPESGNCVDLNGTGGSPQAVLVSNMTFAPGTYLLSFDLIGSQRGSFAGATVRLGSFTQDVQLDSNDLAGGVVTNQLVTVTTPGTLSFTSDNAGNVGLLLDNVSVTAVPLPAGVWLMLSGLIGVATMARRRQVI